MIDLPDHGLGSWFLCLSENDAFDMPSLEAKLKAALASRDERLIRRRLAQPSTKSVDFTSNDYLSLSTYSPLRDLFIARLTAAPHVLGSGGSRLLVNGTAHSALETRLAAFFGAPTALLFNSGFDANVAIFSSLPQPGDIVVHDEAIHASVYDGIRASRIPEASYSFEHNCMQSLKTLLHRLRAENFGLGDGSTSVFVAVESLYSMDGTIAPLQEIVEIVGEMFPMNNGHVIVDEAHATGIYGPLGKGLVAMLELDDKVLVRLHTFGKALAGTGGE
jgi:8-amino-7-oxononanoate synthase